MWDYVDKELSSYNRQYDKINRKTLDEFQNILDNNKDLEEYATRSDFNRLKRAIEDNYEYLFRCCFPTGKKRDGCYAENIEEFINKRLI